MNTVLWKRLNQEGLDACRITTTGTGWCIEGTAVFEHAEQVATFSYLLICDRQWRSSKASVSGWIGATALELIIERDRDDQWCINGNANNELAGLDDIDLGFTPASNTNAIRRLNLSIGDEADSVAIWLDTDDWSVKTLRQTYRRIRSNTFDYVSPYHDYRAALTVDDFGVVTEYPGLWEMLHNRKS